MLFIIFDALPINKVSQVKVQRLYVNKTFIIKRKRLKSSGLKRALNSCYEKLKLFVRIDQINSWNGSHEEEEEKTTRGMKITEKFPFTKSFSLKIRKKLPCHELSFFCHKHIFL